MSDLFLPYLTRFFTIPPTSWHTPVVRVVLRVDPLLQLDSLTIHQNNITLGTHQFTFDKIHPQNHTPNDIYQANLEPLLEPYIQGDSQPSSELDPREEQDDQVPVPLPVPVPELGIIRRFSQALFNHLEETISSASVHVSYAKLENNNANPVDLLHASAPTSGITDEWVMDTDELMSQWSKGSVLDKSLESYGVFTVYLRQPSESKWNIVRIPESSFGLGQLEDILGLTGPRTTTTTTTTTTAVGFGASSGGDSDCDGGDVDNADHHPLIRMLQDSLSHVVVVTCISPKHHETEALESLRNSARLLPNNNHTKHIIKNSQNNKNNPTPHRLRDQVSHLRLDLNSQKNKSLDDEVCQMRQELRQLQSFTQQLSHELALTQTERDSLISRCVSASASVSAAAIANTMDDGSVEPNSAQLLLLMQQQHQQQAETIQRLKREAAEAQKNNNTNNTNNNNNNSSSSNSYSSNSNNNAYYSSGGRIQSPSGRTSQATTPREDSFFRVASTSSGRRKVKHVSVTHRPSLIKRRSGNNNLGSRSPLGGSFTTLNTESLGEVLAMLRHDLDACPSTHSSTEFPRRTDDRTTQPYTANPPPWSQASDETVTPDHAEARPPRDPRSNPLSPMPALLQDDHLQTSLEDDLEALAVPTWTDVPKTQSTNGSTNENHSASRSREGRRHSKDLLKMLHQVQADVLVKRELVGQLEKTEEEYTQMRVNYEEQLSLLHNHIQEQNQASSPVESSSSLTNLSGSITGSVAEREKEPRRGRGRGIGTGITVVTERKDGGTSTGGTSPLVTTQPTPTSTRVGLSRPSSVAQLREERLAQEVRSQYESKLKRMFNENQDLHRKYTQTASTLQTTRTKGQAIVSRLQSTVETLKAEKKQLQKTIRLAADRARDTAVVNEREIQQLRRRELAALEVKKRLEEANEAQAQVIKRKNEDVAVANLHNRLLVNALRKAAGEGTLLNEAALDKIMAGVQTKLSKTRLAD
ncbi:hypothetical protein J3Q64DRAFT_1832876 [Phycomyces blakesleeanus]|uniref:Kinesin motor domain-containing protein n=1 Tax=Phycomyces blakesleeanus TaxID=4837 RepID=A0ABR3B1Z8_PHYBL